MSELPILRQKFVRVLWPFKSHVLGEESKTPELGWVTRSILDCLPEGLICLVIAEEDLGNKKLCFFRHDGEAAVVWVYYGKFEELGAREVEKLRRSGATTDTDFGTQRCV